MPGTVLLAEDRELVQFKPLRPLTLQEIVAVQDSHGELRYGPHPAAAERRAPRSTLRLTCVLACTHACTHTRTLSRGQQETTHVNMLARMHTCTRRRYATVVQTASVEKATAGISRSASGGATGATLPDSSIGITTLGRARVVTDEDGTTKDVLSSDVYTFRSAHSGK